MTMFVQESYRECACAGELLCLCLCRTIVTVFVQENYCACVYAEELLTNCACVCAGELL